MVAKQRLSRKCAKPKLLVPVPSGLQVGSHAAKFCKNLNHVIGSGLLSFFAKTFRCFPGASRLFTLRTRGQEDLAWPAGGHALALYLHVRLCFLTS